MKQERSPLPTIFAKAIAIGVDLYTPDSQAHLDIDEHTERLERLKVFQQMAITQTFDNSIIAYYDIELNDEQRSALELIHMTTKPWLTGHVTGKMLDALEGASIIGQDVVKIAEVIVKELGGNKNPDGNKLKGLLVRFAKIEETDIPESIEEDE